MTDQDWNAAVKMFLDHMERGHGHCGAGWLCHLHEVPGQSVWKTSKHGAPEVGDSVSLHRDAAGPVIKGWRIGGLPGPVVEAPTDPNLRGGDEFRQTLADVVNKTWAWLLRPSEVRLAVQVNNLTAFACPPWFNVQILESGQVMRRDCFATWWPPVCQDHARLTAHTKIHEQRIEVHYRPQYSQKAELVQENWVRANEHDGLLSEFSDKIRWSAVRAFASLV